MNKENSLEKQKEFIKSLIEKKLTLMNPLYSRNIWTNHKIKEEYIELEELIFRERMKLFNL